MLIRKKRIRSLDSYLPRSCQGKELVFGVPLETVSGDTLTRIGFADRPAEGDSVLPSPSFGPVTRYNAEGAVLVHRDRKMETAYRMAEWHWKEWHGRYDQVERSKIVDIPYKRYPRTEVTPPSVELSVVRSPDGLMLLVAPPILHRPSNADPVLHIINLFLEIFGECEVFADDLRPIHTTPLKRLNWHVLPPGQRPWKQLRTEVREMLNQARDGNRAVIEHRLETINTYKPEFVAVGNAGFRGYLIFGFPERSIYLLESTQVDNATYVLGENWESLSQRTKAELLSDKLHQHRIIHRAGWAAHVRQVLQ